MKRKSVRWKLCEVKLLWSEIDAKWKQCEVSRRRKWISDKNMHPTFTQHALIPSSKLRPSVPKFDGRTNLLQHRSESTSGRYTFTNQNDIHRTTIQPRHNMSTIFNLLRKNSKENVSTKEDFPKIPTSEKPKTTHIPPKDDDSDAILQSRREEFSRNIM